MNKILSTLVIAAALSSTAALADDKFRVSMENGKQRVDFSLKGNDKCAIVEGKIRCAPTKQAPIRMASSASNSVRIPPGFGPLSWRAFFGSPAQRAWNTRIETNQNNP